MDTNRLQIADALARFYLSPEAAENLSGEDFATHKASVLSALGKGVSLTSNYQPAKAAVTRFLDQALTNAPPHPVLDAIRPFMKDLHWQTNKNYHGHFEEKFFENEAFAEIIGPKGMLRTDVFRAGLLLMGPEIDYPGHNHEASEWYNVLSGTGLWRQGGNAFSLCPPPSAIFHSSWEVHAMRCQKTPVLALWSWAGNMSSEAMPV